MLGTIEKPHKISLIVAVGRNGAIGKDNKLIWTIKDDLKRFREITAVHPIIMGKNTYLSIGRPLPNRTNIVLTTSELEAPSEVLRAESLEKAFKISEGRDGSDEIFVIGGASVYAQAMPFADKLYLTIIDAEAPADTFFPDWKNDFKKETFREDRTDPETSLNYSWV